MTKLKGCRPFHETEIEKLRADKAFTATCLKVTL